MSYQVLARKWRPRNFTELVGQEHVARALINALDNNRLHHAFLFTGTRGVGKTTIARILAKSLNCEKGVGSRPCETCSACTEINEGRFIDLIEVDAASRTKVDETRELLDNVVYAPTRGRYKVYLIDEVHMFSNHSFNALLKTLEEPPPHVKFLLATTDPQKLPVTILSRCLQFNLKRLPQEQIRDYLAKVLSQENITSDAGALALIARAADGSMRDALSLLDQAIAYGSGQLAESDVRAMLGAIEQTHIIDLLHLLAASDGPGLMARVMALAEHTPDFGGVLSELISTLHRIALAQTAPAAIDDSLGDRAAILDLASRLAPEDVQLYYQIGLIGRRDLPLAPDPRSGFEMILLRMLAFRPVDAQSASAGPATASQPQPAATELAREPRPASAPATRAGTVVNSTPANSTAANSPPSSSPPSSSPPSSLAAASPATTELTPDNWESVVQQLGLSGMNQQLALHSAFVKRDGDRLELGIAPAHKHLQGKAREKALADALGQYLGHAVQLSFSRAAAPGDTPADRQQVRSEERLEGARTAIANDDAVQAFKEVFGAQVHPNSVQPLDQ